MVKNDLATLESLAYQRRANLPVEQALPLVFKALSVRVERLLDLSDPSVLSKLDTSVEKIRTEKWWLNGARNEESFTQAIGRAAHRFKMQALLSLSSQSLDHGVNII